MERYLKTEPLKTNTFKREETEISNKGCTKSRGKQECSSKKWSPVKCDRNKEQRMTTFSNWKIPPVIFENSLIEQ